MGACDLFLCASLLFSLFKWEVLRWSCLSGTSVLKLYTFSFVVNYSYLTTCMLSGRRTAAGWPAHQPGGLQTRHVHNPCSIMTFKTLDQTTIIVDFYLGHMLTQPLPVLFRLGCWTSSWWLDEDNQLLLQTQKVDSLPSQLQLAMRGSGCTLVQTVLRYSYCYS